MTDLGASLTRAGRLVVVADSSSSMDRHLAAIKAGLAELFRQAPDGVAIGLITYSAGGVKVLADPVPLDHDARTKLLEAVNGLTSTPGTARPIFDALTLSYQHVLAGAPGRDPAPILMAITDGGRSGGSDLQTFVTFAKAESAKRARAATSRFIGITPGADVSLLSQVVAAVGGKVATADTDDRLRAAILDLPGSSPAIAPIPTPTPTAAPTPD